MFVPLSCPPVVFVVFPRRVRAFVAAVFVVFPCRVRAFCRRHTVPPLPVVFRHFALAALPTPTRQVVLLY